MGLFEALALENSDPTGTRILKALASGSEAHIYLPGTTTYASLFTDEGLTIATPNPTGVDDYGNVGPVSGGVAGKIYLADGSYDLEINAVTYRVDTSGFGVAAEIIDRQNADAAHVAATDPHGDRAYADTLGDLQFDPDAIAGYGGIWPKNVVPGATNYGVSVEEDGTATNLNSGGHVVLRIGGAIRVWGDNTGVAVNGNTPVAKAAAISSPAADAAELKTAVDAIRVALANFGITL